GAWGNGKESYGILKWLGEGLDQPLTPDLIDVSCLGAIIVAGGTLDPDGLRQAETQQVRGIIVGSMSATLRERVAGLSFPVMLVEGLGTVPMATPAAEVFRSNSGREAGLRAISQTRWGAQRPEVVVPLSPREGISGDVPPPSIVLQQ